jgi:hypothetical protein
MERGPVRGVIGRASRLITLAAAAACGGAPPLSAPHPVPDTTAQAPPPAVSPLLAPTPPARRYAPVRLAFVGDINLGTSTLADGVPPDEGRGLLDRARPALVGDLVVGNFEGVLADTGSSVKCEWLRARIARQQRELRRLRRLHRVPPPDTTSEQAGCFAFRTPTALAPRLREAGFTHLNLANNHANDFGPAGRASTEALLDSLGIDFYGPIGRIAIDSVRRGDSLTTVGLIGFATYPFAYDLLDIQRSAAVVDSIRPLVDLLLVTFHGGSEGVRALHTPEQAESLGHEPRGELRRWAHAVIDAGADGVVGHGPHVLRGIELYRGRPIVYSLGNFLTYRGFSLAGPLGVTGVLQLEYAPDRRLRGARIVPMRQFPLQGPAPDPDGQALELVRQLSGEDFGDAGAQVGNDGEIVVGP